jgi:hypothetical protein
LIIYSKKIDLKNKIIIVSMLCIGFSACVQKTYRKTVVFSLDVHDAEEIKSVAIRGAEKPLSWRKDVEMRSETKDSLYRITVSFLTGYKFTEVKFVVNGEFELKDKDNRRVNFDEGDTTFYSAVFNSK